MLGVLAALCALRDYSGMPWTMAFDCKIAHTEKNVVTNRRRDARAQRLVDSNRFRGNLYVSALFLTLSRVWIDEYGDCGRLRGELAQ
jgi:hypothetical protein